MWPGEGGVRRDARDVDWTCHLAGVAQGITHSCARLGNAITPLVATLMIAVSGAVPS